MEEWWCAVSTASLSAAHTIDPSARLAPGLALRLRLSTGIHRDTFVACSLQPRSHPCRALIPAALTHKSLTRPGAQDSQQLMHCRRCLFASMLAPASARIDYLKEPQLRHSVTTSSPEMNRPFKPNVSNFF